MPTDPSKPSAETAQQQFERVLSQPSFEGLKAILNRLSPDQEKHYTAVVGANSYIEMLSRLGYKLTVVRQIHVQDSYQRLGPEGGVKAVLPYYDIPTQSSLPTLVNLNATVTATPKSAAFFDALLTNLKKQLTA
jgi:hypothetical protein